MAMKYILILAILLGLVIVYNFVDGARVSANQWFDTTLNGEIYCPSGSVESVKWAISFNGLGLEHTKTKDGQFCFQTKDKLLADKIIKDAQDRELELKKIQEQESGKTNRLFLIIGGIILLVIVLWAIFGRGSSSFY